jgi:hypothetical protein
MNKIIKEDRFRLTDSIHICSEDADISYPESGYDGCFAIEDKSFWFYHRNNIIADVVKKYSPKRSLFFDIGGGNGFVVNRLKQLGYTPVLFEPGLQGAKHAKSRGIENIFVSLFNKDVINPNTAYNLGLFDVLEHIEDDTAYLV